MVVADIPGLIPGAHEGKGLGIQFLKHVERTHVLLHLVDISALYSDDPIEECLAHFLEIQQELAHFSEGLAARPYLVGLTKTDAVSDQNLKRELLDRFRDAGHETMIISSVSGEGLDRLMPRLFEIVIEARSVPPTEEPESLITLDVEEPESLITLDVEEPESLNTPESEEPEKLSAADVENG
jgi:GTP-binding protein